VATIEETTVEDFDRLFAINVRTPFFLVQQLLPIMSKEAASFSSPRSRREPLLERNPRYAATKGASTLW